MKSFFRDGEQMQQKPVGAATERVASYQLHLEAMHEAYRQARWASWLALWINAVLTVGKLIAGLLGHSLAWSLMRSTASAT